VHRPSRLAFPASGGDLAPREKLRGTSPAPFGAHVARRHATFAAVGDLARA